MNKPLARLLTLSKRQRNLQEVAEYALLVSEIDTQLKEIQQIRKQIIDMKADILTQCPICDYGWNKK